jgi:hypothetical protein
MTGTLFSRVFFYCLLRGYVILLICVLIVPAEPNVFRTREGVAGMQKYPQYKAGKVGCTGHHRTVPCDNSRCYPAFLSCLFSFFLPSGNHLWFLNGRRTGPPSCIRIPIGPHIIRI